MATGIQPVSRGWVGLDAERAEVILLSAKFYRVYQKNQRITNAFLTAADYTDHTQYNVPSPPPTRLGSYFVSKRYTLPDDTSYPSECGRPVPSKFHLLLQRPRTALPRSHSAEAFRTDLSPQCEPDSHNIGTAPYA